VLVINKMDRLVCEVRMTPSEAAVHLHRLIENVNALVATFHVADAMRDHKGDSQSVGLSDADKWEFSPALGNVVFCSAFDQWAFSIPQLVCAYTCMTYFVSLFQPRHITYMNIDG
jgi:ribosome assembly protein 1